MSLAFVARLAEQQKQIEALGRALAELQAALKAMQDKRPVLTVPKK